MEQKTDNDNDLVTINTEDIIKPVPATEPIPRKQPGSSLLHPVLKLLEERKEQILNDCSKYFAINEQSIPLADLDKVVAALSGICNTDLKGLTSYILENIPKESAVVLFDTFFALAKQWILAFVPNEPVRKVSSEVEKLINAFSRNEEEIKQEFAKYSGNKGFIPLGKVKDILLESLKIARIELEEAGSTKSRSILLEQISSYVIMKERNKASITRGVDYDTFLAHLKDFVSHDDKIIVNTLLPEDNEDFKAKVQNTIKQYESLMENQRNLGKNTSATKSFITMLKSYLGKVVEKHSPKKVAENFARRQSEKRGVQEPALSIEERREKGINEIFSFYCRQQRMLGKNATFEQMESALSHMNMGEFLKFAKDFLIPIKVDKLKDLFRKCAKLGKELDIDCFIVVLQKMANQVVADKLEAFQEKLGKVEEELLSLENAMDSKNIERKDQLATEQSHYEDEIAYLEQKTDKQNLLDLYCFLECDDPVKYRRKMGTIALPFSTKDKSYRIPLNDPSRKYKFRTNKTIEEINSQVASIRQARISKLREREREVRDKYAKNRLLLDKIYDKQETLKRSINSKDITKIISVPEEEPYSSNNQNNFVQRKPQLTWNLVNNLTHNDIKASNESGLRLADLVNDTEEGDEIIKKVQTKIKLQGRNVGLSVPRSITQKPPSHLMQLTEVVNAKKGSVKPQIEDDEDMMSYRPANIGRNIKYNKTGNTIERASQIETEERLNQNLVSHAAKNGIEI